MDWQELGNLLMGYQPRSGAKHGFRGRQDKIRSKSQRSKAQPKTKSRMVEETTSTLLELEETTLAGLGNLGSQSFALPPFCDNFDLWLTSLKTLLTRFESSKLVTMDDQYVTECDLAVSRVESELGALKLKETSSRDCLGRLADARNNLSQIDESYAQKQKKLEKSRVNETRCEPDQVDNTVKNLELVDKIKVSFFRRILKKERTRQEEVTELRRNSIETPRNATAQSCLEEEIGLRKEYEREKNLAVENLRICEKEAEALGALSQFDESLAVRKHACDTLTNSVKGLLEREQKTATETF